MNTVLKVVRAFVFLLFASFASNAVSATVFSATGTASLDGAWSFGCSDPDFEEGGTNDELEFLIYQGNTVESRVYLFASADETCSGGIVAVETEGPFDIIIEQEPVTIEGWLGEDEFENEILVDPPARQDGNGLLPAGSVAGEPFLASEETFIIPGEEDESGCVYVDDTDTSQNGLNWYLYRCEGENDTTFVNLLDTGEALIKAELPVVGVIPLPAGIWLFGTALIGFVGYSRRRKMS